MDRPNASRPDDNLAVQFVRRPRRGDAIGASLRQAYGSARADDEMRDILAKLNAIG